ncbi:MAG: hypothetical protein L0G99_10605 [Propionibacteriales bacterium]|nr:hypothetical protein [Propionibacteriales bacterium]
MSPMPQDANEEFDSYDPTAPAVSEDSPTLEPEGEPELPSGAISDPTGSVHAWFDEDSHLTDVRISNRWRARLRGEPLAKTVETVITGMAVAGLGPQWAPKTSTPPATPLSDAALDRLMERSVVADERAAELTARDDVTETRYVGEEVVGQSSNRQVRITFGITGRPSVVTVEDEWLGHAQAAVIAEAIMEAYRDGREQWVEPIVEPGEWDLLAAERLDIRDEVMALFRHGI